MSDHDLIFSAITLMHGIPRADLAVVQCSSTVECTSSDLGAMTARDCCIGNPESFAYTLPGSEVCHVCIGRFSN